MKESEASVQLLRVQSWFFSTVAWSQELSVVMWVFDKAPQTCCLSVTQVTWDNETELDVSHVLDSNVMDCHRTIFKLGIDPSDWFAAKNNTQHLNVQKSPVRLPGRPGKNNFYVGNNRCNHVSVCFSVYGQRLRPHIKGKMDFNVVSITRAALNQVSWFLVELAHQFEYGALWTSFPHAGFRSIDCGTEALWSHVSLSMFNVASAVFVQWCRERGFVLKNPRQRSGGKNDVSCTVVWSEDISLAQVV